MQAQPQIGASHHARVVLRFEPPCAQLDTPRRQPRESPFELGPPGAVARDQNHEVREAAGRRSLPAADALFEPDDCVDGDVEVLVFGPAGGTYDESGDAAADVQA